MGAKKYVYFFGKGRADGSAAMKNLLGGKGSNLAEMTNLGIPVPPGFTISTEACVESMRRKGTFPPGMWAQVEKLLRRLEQVMGLTFGDREAPLLVSVRSGARVSMPGMMDTVLNLGLNDQAVEGLARRSRNPRFAYDSYRRFIQMFSNVVLDISVKNFEAILEKRKRDRGVELDTDLSADDLRLIVREYKALVRGRTGREFPQEPRQQLRLAVGAVFGSWNNPRAIKYREIHRLPHTWGTAVNVQAMVFGNLGESSGTGVAFTRDPATGKKRLYGEFLMNAQGEDVVAGIRTPQPVEQLRRMAPRAYRELDHLCRRLEKHYRDMQDVEFTMQEGKLYLLQTRTGKRTPAAAVKIAVDMQREGLIDKRLALLRVDPHQIELLLHPMLDPTAKRERVAHGLPASPGAAVGRAVFTAEDAEAWAGRGEKVILVRAETSPEDVGGMHAAQGIVTARGGMTSHAAVVARGMGKPCIVGCGDITIAEEARRFVVKGRTVREGDWITIEGSTGDVMLGQLPLVQSELSGDFALLVRWADAYRTIGIRTNADTPADAAATMRFGAEGIGLCRTEHMFFEEARIIAMREMIVADEADGRRKALAKLLPMQRSDFKAIFEEMKGLPVTIRLFDPPLHEFLPKTAHELETLAADMGIPLERLQRTVQALQEFNPMLGERGCRLAITFPEITEMQVRAIFEAACAMVREKKKVFPEVMVPLVSTVHEFRHQRTIIDRVAAEVMREAGVKVRYLVGTMIEIPRACLVADQIAAEADFFSFGTNDLTQTTFGFSRDDAGKFLARYLEEGILTEDPFISLDEEGVGQLMAIGVKKGRGVRKKLEIGICGEHGGDPRSVAYCHRLGLDYVSCSPYRVPVAKAAAAHAALKEQVQVVVVGEH
ncbi:MAG TPA: pyruvate, phosphate dikinase [Candidatus Methylomirabilis sp.]|nr:pyruvate, phosphate dikinase [Candidatus Methylomirabilis sp.]